MDSRSIFCGNKIKLIPKPETLFQSCNSGMICITYSSFLNTFLLQVLQKWGEYAQDVQFILQRSALDKANSTAPLSPPAPRAKLGLGPGQGPGGQKSASAEPPAVWKPPPPAASYPGSGPVSNPGPGVPGAKNGVGARLSPDSGRGSDRTGSDSSNSYPDHHSRLASQVNGFHNNIPKSSSASQVFY